METLFNKLLESAKTNKKGFAKLKTAAVTCQQYELAIKLRDIELELFPESEEAKEAKLLVKGLKVALNLVGLPVADQTIYIIYQTFNAHKKMKNEFDLTMASEIIEKAKDIFYND